MGSKIKPKNLQKNIMNIDLDKIKKLPPDVRKDFMKMYLKFGEKKKISHIQSDFFKFCETHVARIY